MSAPTVAPQPPVSAPANAPRAPQRRRGPRNRNGNASSSADTPSQPEQQQQPQAGQQSQRGGGRGGRGRGRGGRNGAGASLQPSTAPELVPASVQEAAHRSTRGGRGGRGGGRGRGGPERPPQRMAAGGRQFGGQLTVEEDTASISSEAPQGLQPDAPSFQPGKPIAPRKPRPPKQKQPQAPKSTAPDIATRTHEDIDNGHYDDGNLKKTLKCDDECARLERNRVLALALNVDPDHQSDHIPYSDATLNMYQQNSTWAATQEKQLRIFAADPDAKRLRFKPMPRNQRGFIHSLAEDFGMDSESMDPEPHRHVAIFKTPKFVMAPMRTLAECARTRQIQQRIVPTPAPAATPAAALRPKPTNANTDPYNAFLILNPRFALTIEELAPIIKSVLSTTSFRCELEITFLSDESVALKPPLAARLSIPEPDMQAMLESIRAPLAQALNAHSIGKIQLARLDSTLTVLRKESDMGPGSGWSQVAASKGVPLRQVPKSTPFGNKGGFAVLSLSSKKKKKEEPVEVAEDWEAAEEEEEQKEKTSGANSDIVGEDEGAVLEDLPEASGTRATGKEDKAASSSEDVLLTTQPLPGRWSDLEEDE
ncbi:hypothetical protein yc1106_07047 [Curvularia clavata]|uniref:R3H domain-containing protein n=1 Tax=Curvularia clavata TaxID=95742 RepID=A0A9Q8ZGI7_CURCL|nr:hypothetical protein yc1106_07047 [Curvularia clavata]